MPDTAVQAAEPDVPADAIAPEADAATRRARDAGATGTAVARREFFVARREFFVARPGFLHARGSAIVARRVLVAARRGIVAARRAVTLRWCAIAAALLLVLPWAFVMLFTPPPGRVLIPPVPGGAPATLRVFLVGWGYHSSIVLEQPDDWRLGPQGDETARFVEYGWGDRRFFMESNYWPHALFATLFLPTESVVYVRGMSEPPAEAAGARDVFVRDCAADEVRRLAVTLEQAFARTEAGARPSAFPRVEGYAGRFYPGREYYLFWSNCNTWTLRALRDAGFDASPALVVFEEQLGGHLRGFRRASEIAPPASGRGAQS